MTISKNGNIKLGPVGTLIVTTIITMLSFMCWKTIDIGERVSKLEGWKDSTVQPGRSFGP